MLRRRIAKGRFVGDDENLADHTNRVSTAARLFAFDARASEEQSLSLP
jgi:hypothetical protein